MSTWYVLTIVGKVVLWFFAILALGSVADLACAFRKIAYEFERMRTTLERMPQVARTAARAAAPPVIPASAQPFRIRRSWKDTRIQWEAEHNTKAQRNASLQEQIRKAQEGTLR